MVIHKSSLFSSFFLCIVGSCLLASACNPKSNDANHNEETRETVFLSLEPLQGVWMDEDTQSPYMWIKKDSVIYAHHGALTTTVQWSSDSLWLGKASYKIEQYSPHHLSLSTLSSNSLHLYKSEDEADTLLFQTISPQPVLYTEVTHRDTISYCQGVRLHSYITINPTSKKVFRTLYDAEGLQMENYYFDNIIHLSVYEGNQCIFRKNIEKGDFADYIPREFLAQAILSDLLYENTDSKGVHFRTKICIPEDTACYMIELIIDLQGTLHCVLRDY